MPVAATARLQRTGALAVLLTLFFTCYLAAAYGLGLYLFPVLLPDMQAALGISYTTVGLISGAAQAGYMIAALVAGILTPKIGGGRLVFLAIAICAVTLSLLSMVHGVWALGIGLTILGATASTIWVPTVEVVSRYIPERGRATVFGIFSSAGGYGAMLNGMVVPPLLIASGWRSVWLAMGLGTLALAVVGAIVLGRLGVLTRQTVSTAGNKVRLRGVLTLLKSRLVLLLLLMMFFISVAYMPFQTYLAAYLRNELGFSIPATGLLWTIFGIAAAAGGAILGFLADRIGIRRAILVTLALLMLAALLMAFYPVGWLPFVAAAAFGISYGAIYGLLPAYISRMIALPFSSMVFGFGNVMLGLGGIAGNLLGGYSKTLFGELHTLYSGVGVVTVILTLLTISLQNDRTATTEQA
jgi:MFS family permease